MTATLSRHSTSVIASKSKGSMPLLATTTLFLEDFGVRCGCSSCDYTVNVGLTVNALDDYGFVTDNIPFINMVQEINKTTAAEVANSIITIARDQIGNRLVRISGQVKPRTGDDVTIKWRVKSDILPTEPPGKKIEFIHEWIRTTLVDNAICGGYDGQFKYNLICHTSNKNRHGKFQRLLESSIQRKFDAETYKASCEELASGLVAATCAFSPKQMHHVVARVYNKTGYAETTWSHGMKVPKFPRPASRQEIRESRGNRRESVVVSIC